jgi:hypothetical protein
VHRRQETIVKDYTSYPIEFPFKDPSCLVRPGYTAAQILQMHLEDLAERERIVAELAAPVVTRSVCSARGKSDRRGASANPLCTLIYRVDPSM